jgi:CRP-like cAMP-binding protein
VMQSPREQEVLRDQAEVEEFQDEQVVDLALFDLESLELDDDDTVDWEDRVSLWEGQEEPSTRELMLDDTSGVRPQPKQMQREFRISALPEIPLFSKLPRQVFLDFLNAMEMGRAQPGEVILSPDDPATGLYVIMRGWVRVERELSDGRVVELAQMGEGEVFGEFRLLTGDDRESQVVAETEVEFFAVSDEVVYEIGRDHPEMWDVLWGFYYERMLNHSMAASEIFGNLNAEERDLVARHFDLSEALADDVLFRIGESVEYLSLIVSGSVEIRVGSDAVTTLQQGDFLGVTPCAIDGPAGATAVAQTDLVLLQMPGRIFRDLLYGLPDVAEAVRQEVRERNAVAGVEEDRPPLTKLL